MDILTFSGVSETGLLSGASSVALVSLVPEPGINGRFEMNSGTGRLLKIPRMALPIPPALPPSGFLSSVSLRVTYSTGLAPGSIRRY